MPNDRPTTTPKPHWNVAFEAWLKARPRLRKLGQIEQLEAFQRAFPHLKDATHIDPSEVLSRVSR